MHHARPQPTADLAMHDQGPIHPGRILNERFLIPHQLSANKLALRLGIPPNSITAIINGTRGVSGPMSKLLGRAFNVPETFFANLHTRYQLDMATIEAERGRHRGPAAEPRRRAGQGAGSGLIRQLPRREGLQFTRAGPLQRGASPVTAPAR